MLFLQTFVNISKVDVTYSVLHADADPKPDGVGNSLRPSFHIS